MHFGKKLFTDVNGKRYRCFVEDGGSRDFFEALLKEGGAEIVKSLAACEKGNHTYLLVARLNFKVSKQILDWGWTPVDLEFVVRSCTKNLVQDLRKYRLGRRREYSVSFKSDRKKLFEQILNEGYFGPDRNIHECDSLIPLAVSTQFNPGPTVDFGIPSDISTINTQCTEQQQDEEGEGRHIDNLALSKRSHKRKGPAAEVTSKLTMQQAFRMLVAQSESHEHNEVSSTTLMPSAGSHAANPSSKTKPTASNATSVGETSADLGSIQNPPIVVEAQDGLGAKQKQASEGGPAKASNSKYFPKLQATEAHDLPDAKRMLLSESNRAKATTSKYFPTLHENVEVETKTKPKEAEPNICGPVSDDDVVVVDVEADATEARAAAEKATRTMLDSAVHVDACTSPTPPPSPTVWKVASAARPGVSVDGQEPSCSRYPALNIVSHGKRRTPFPEDTGKTSSKKRLTDIVELVSSSDDEFVVRNQNQRTEPPMARTIRPSEESSPPLGRMQSKRGQVHLYTWQEKQCILKYLCRHKEYARVKGNAVWEAMEMARVCPNRTSQSMKEHFRKKLMPQISSFHFLTDEQKRLFRRYQSYDYRKQGPPAGLDPDYSQARPSSASSLSPSPPRSDRRRRQKAAAAAAARPTPSTDLPKPRLPAVRPSHRRLFRQASMSPSPSPVTVQRRRTQPQPAPPVAAPAPAQPAGEALEPLPPVREALEPLPPVASVVSLAAARSLEMERFFLEAVSQPSPAPRFKRIVQRPVSSDEEDVVGPRATCLVGSTDAATATAAIAAGKVAGGAGGEAGITTGASRKASPPPIAARALDEALQPAVKEASQPTIADHQVNEAERVDDQAVGLPQSPELKAGGSSADFVEDSPYAKKKIRTPHFRRSRSLPRILKRFSMRLDEIDSLPQPMSSARLDDLNPLPRPEASPTEDVGPTPCHNTPPPCNKTPPPCNKTPPPCNKTPPPCNKTPPPCSETPPPRNKTPPLCSQTPPPCSQTPPPCSQTPPPCSQTPPPESKTPPLSISSSPLLTACGELDRRVVAETSSDESTDEECDLSLPSGQQRAEPVLVTSAAAKNAIDSGVGVTEVSAVVDDDNLPLNVTEVQPDEAVEETPCDINSSPVREDLPVEVSEDLAVDDFNNSPVHVMDMNMEETPCDINSSPVREDLPVEVSEDLAVDDFNNSPVHVMEVVSVEASVEVLPASVEVAGVLTVCSSEEPTANVAGVSHAGVRLPSDLCIPAKSLSSMQEEWRKVKKERRCRDLVAGSRSSSSSSDGTVSLSDDEFCGNPQLQEARRVHFVDSLQRMTRSPIVEVIFERPLFLDVLGTTPDLLEGSSEDVVSAVCPACCWRARYSDVRFNDRRAGLAFCPRCPAARHQGVDGGDGAGEGVKLELMFWLELVVVAGDDVMEVVAAGPVAEQLFCCSPQEFLIVAASRELFLGKLCRRLKFHGTLLIVTLQRASIPSASVREREDAESAAAAISPADDCVVATETRQGVATSSRSAPGPVNPEEAVTAIADTPDSEAEVFVFLGQMWMGEP